jgi:carbonic anhydrase/acetyltransferase-like protein (isoleucine patch superfamily)
VWDFASIGYEAVVRGDVKLVRIGAFTTIGEGVTIAEAFSPLNDNHDGSTIVGHYVSIGANSVLRACTIEPECTVGVGCSLMEGTCRLFCLMFVEQLINPTRFIHVTQINLGCRIGVDNAAKDPFESILGWFTCKVCA